MYFCGKWERRNETRHANSSKVRSTFSIYDSRSCLHFFSFFIPPLRQSPMRKRAWPRLRRLRRHSRACTARWSWPPRSTASCTSTTTSSPRRAEFSPSTTQTHTAARRGTRLRARANVERDPLVECPSHSTEQRVQLVPLLVSVRLLVRPSQQKTYLYLICTFSYLIIYCLLFIIICFPRFHFSRVSFPE